MKSDRRDFLKTVVLGIVSAGPVVSLLSCDNSQKSQKAIDKYPDGIEISRGYKVLEAETQKNIAPLAAVILPGVEKIGIKEIFMEKMSENHGDAGFFDAGLWNANTISNMQYKKPFYQLETKEQLNDVAMIISKSNSPFFNKFKREIITIYYSHPLSWKSLAYIGPPQPNGFLAYYEAPQYN